MNNLQKKTFIWAIITAIAYTAFFVLFDRRIVCWIHGCAPAWVHEAGTYISYFAQGSFIRTGLAICFILIIVCDAGMKKKWTRVLLYICLSVSIAIIIGEGSKYVLARYRPIKLFEENLYGFSFFSTKWTLNSAPSGHTLRAFAIATAVSMLYRRAGIIFIIAAVLVGIGRVAVTDHYPSDVIFGAFIGIFTAIWTGNFFTLAKSAEISENVLMTRNRKMKGQG